MYPNFFVAAVLWGTYAGLYFIPRSWLLGMTRVAAPILSGLLRWKVARKNLRIIAPDRDETRLLTEAIRHQLCTIVDLFKLAAQKTHRIPELVRIEGWEVLEAVLARGKGAVLVSAHQGNWEVAGAAVAMRGVPMHAFYFEQLSPALDRFLTWSRLRSGMKMLHQRRGLRDCLRALRSGGAVGFVADQDGSKDGVFLDFFGRLVSMPRGPYEFARHSGGAVVPASMRRTEEDSYVLTFHPPLTVATEEDVPAAARAMAAIFEADIRREPAQWQVFYDRFWLRHIPRLRELGLLDRAAAEHERDSKLGEPERVSISPDAFVKIAVLFYGPFLLAGLAWMAYEGRLSELGWSGGYPGLGRAMMLGSALAGIVLLLTRFVTPRFSWGQAMEEAFREVLQGIGPAQAVALAAISSTAEEVVFRGVLQPEIGLVWASLLFGLVHFPAEPRLRAWTVFAIAMGFSLGYLYQTTGGLLAPVLAHFLVNAVNLAWLGDYPQTPPPDQSCNDGIHMT